MFVVKLCVFVYAGFVPNLILMGRLCNISRVECVLIGWILCLYSELPFYW